MYQLLQPLAQIVFFAASRRSPLLVQPAQEIKVVRIEQFDRVAGKRKKNIEAALWTRCAAFQEMGITVRCSGMEIQQIETRSDDTLLDQGIMSGV